MLAEDGGEFVIFLLLVGGGNRVEVGERVFVLPDVVGLDVFLENTALGEVELVGTAPDGEAGANVGGVLEALKKRVRSEILFVVAMGDDLALVGELFVRKLGGVEAEELRLADLLGVAEKLVAVLLGAFPSTLELLAGGLAFDN